VVEVEPLGWLFFVDVSGLRIGPILNDEAVLDEFFSDCLTSECVTDMLLCSDFLILEDGTEMSSRNVGNQQQEGTPQLKTVVLWLLDTQSHSEC
jgi:hypothetical protein